MPISTINNDSFADTAVHGQRNLIINGAMQVAQRGTSSTSSGFLIDRFNIQNVSDGAFSATQDTSAPSGFEKSMKIEVTTADTSLSSVQNLRCEYRVEGQDVPHLEWGTSNAKTVTLSFYVRSSLTGAFSGAINNSAFNRAYPFTYTISSANTWEYKTVTIEGDTTGTWLTTNGIGMNVCWSLGAGSSRVGTAGAWAAVNVQGVSGQVELIGTANATWQITGVQLEVGETATPFEHRSYSDELRRCQRYYYASSIEGYTWAPNTSLNNAASMARVVAHPVILRANPTVTYQFTDFDQCDNNGVSATNAHTHVYYQTRFSGQYCSGRWIYQVDAEL